MVHPPANPESMTSLVLEHAGSQPRVRAERRPVPVPPPGHVLVRMEAAAFCHHDALIMSGVLRRGVRLPRVLGHEGAGVLAACGDEVDEGWIGLGVVLVPGSLGHREDGLFSEYVVAPWDSLVWLQEGVAVPDAALLACPIGVALKAVEDVAAVRPGETVLVTGASGGLALHAAQAANAAGATVLGVTGSAEKTAQLEQMGFFSSVLPGGDSPWEELARAMTDERGVDVVIDTGGGELARGVRALARCGRLVLMGQVSEQRSSFFPAEAVFREARILGSLGAERRHVERALTLARSGKVRPVVDRVLPMSVESLMEAHRLLRERAVLGRVVFSAG